jgi:hypothetical protein
MTARTLSAIGLLIWTTTTTALAYEDLNGSHLLKACNAALVDPKTLDADGHALIGYCAGLIHGVSNGQRGAHAASPSSVADLHFCLPESMTIQEGARVVAKYLNEHPERLQEDASELAKAALGSAFPCKLKGAK